MKQIMLHGVNDWRLDDIAEPEPGPRDALIRVAACGICGTDVSYVHMGLTPGPDGRYHDEELPLARENIDILALLEEKTKGNLTGQEERLIGSVLVDLRARFADLAAEKGVKP